ncbi:methyltransferase [Streptomyces sp. NPDC057099]|uniref:methyltransferase n=1 Tax=Streptomyces sp. NPDC057099 TaxID=3346019 RepID=UPI0036273E39
MADVVAPWAARVAATLRLADLLRYEAKPVAVLAAEAGADEDALGRLLRFLSCRGVFIEQAPGTFAMNATAEPLLDDHPMGLRIWMDLNGLAGRFDAVYSAGLLDAVRTGADGYTSVYGRSFWEDLHAHGRVEEFDRMMSSDAGIWMSEVAAQHDWDRVGRVTDVGGGNGALLKELLGAHAGLRGTLVDLPGSVPGGKATLTGFPDRVSFSPGSFFDPLPEGSDVYVLAHVLHDWNDSDARKILARCAEVAGLRGRVLVIDRTGAEEDDLLEFTEMDLKMMVLFGAKERTADEFAALGESEGLSLCSAKPLEAGLTMMEFAPHGA